MTTERKESGDRETRVYDTHVGFMCAVRVFEIKKKGYLKGTVSARSECRRKEVHTITIYRRTRR